jgi:hypothetical protein
MTPYAAQYEHDLSQRPLGCRVGLRPALSSSVATTRQATYTPIATDPGRGLLCGAERLRLAVSARQLPAVADRVLLLSPLAQRRDMGAHPYGVARADSTAAGTRGDAQRRHPGQSNGQDELKGGSAATTRTNRRRDASGICWWIPRASCSRSWYPLPMCRIVTVRASSLRRFGSMALRCCGWTRRPARPFLGVSGRPGALP